MEGCLGLDVHAESSKLVGFSGEGKSKRTICSVVPWTSSTR